MQQTMTDDTQPDSTLSRIGRTAATHRKAVYIAVILLVAVSAVGAAGVQMSLGMDLYVEEDSETMTDWNENPDGFR